MLQVMGRMMRLSSRPLCLTLLALSIALPNFSPRYGFAGDKPNQPTHDAATPKQSEIERPPFDLTYVPPDAMGVIAIRPSAIFSDPAMHPLSRMADEGLTEFLKYFEFPKDRKLPIEEIEQVVGNITIVPNKNGKHGSHHNLMIGLTMIRAAHDFDWRKLMKQTHPKTEEIRHKGRVYYRSHYPKSCACMSPNATFCYFLPDKRTVVFLNEKTLPAFLAGPPDQRPHFPWDKDWKRVECGLFAVAIDNRWASGLSKEQIGGDPDWAFLFQDSVTMVVGVDWKDGMDIQAYLAYKEPDAAKQAIRDFKTFLTQSLRSLKQVALEPGPADVGFRVRVGDALINHMCLTRRESTVFAHTKASMTVADFVKGMMLNISITPQ